MKSAILFVSADCKVLGQSSYCGHDTNSQRSCQEFSQLLSPIPSSAGPRIIDVRQALSPGYRAKTKNSVFT